MASSAHGHSRQGSVCALRMPPGSQIQLFQPHFWDTHRGQQRQCFQNDTSWFLPQGPNVLSNILYYTGMVSSSACHRQGKCWDTVGENFSIMPRQSRFLQVPCVGGETRKRCSRFAGKKKKYANGNTWQLHLSQLEKILKSFLKVFHF